LFCYGDNSAKAQAQQNQPYLELNGHLLQKR
jgi:hypothetical protein